ncbi:kelch-like protein 5 [Biomphalaria pfeifferi]|uniref:Kelch-like protein 5 n=1 Tax=Biomphalaria pfeifferi TaxID=112525 RepID=A0AAD8F2K2_BIOPF|nr:kelch-like protein 5 [Biomphalaria pfeifferi]
MTSFKDEVNTYILQSCGHLWKIVQSAADSVDFEFVEKLRHIDWPLHGVVIVMNELYIFGVRSPKLENNVKSKRSVQRFNKIYHIYYSNSTEKSTFVPFILKRKG